MSYIPSFNDAQIQHIKRYGGERRTYTLPSILIVEDQEFSLKLLQSMLSRRYVCHTATSTETAIAAYAEHVPSITFLDIELPDASGHDLAALIKKHDPDSFIVMVTANHYENDVTLARQNQVQGFIIKPYSQKKIADAIERFQDEHKLRYRRK